jgi:GABA(A) receptor-associated protein
MYYTVSFKKEFSYSDRWDEAQRVLHNFPERIPIICERHECADYNCPNIDKRKYLVPHYLTIGQFLLVIRKRIKIDSDKSIYFIINQTIPPSQSRLIDVYNQHKDSDGFLYIKYTYENVFG